MLLALNTATFIWIYHLTTKDEVSATTPEIELVELLGDPKHITIERGFPVGSRHTLSNEEEGWNLTTPFKWPAAEYAVSKLAGRLRHIELRRLFSIEKIDESTGLEPVDPINCEQLVTHLLESGATINVFCSKKIAI